MQDIEELQTIKVESCVVGKAIYEGKISIEEIQAWNLKSLISF
jgi:phosphoribosylformimino-5-aminoimidazole carboxamide ribotide isomerase